MKNRTPRTVILRPVRPDPLRADPTRTAFLRRSLSAELGRVFARLGREVTPTINSFCPTGEGGGVDPSCNPNGRKGRSATGHPFLDHALAVHRSTPEGLGKNALEVGMANAGYDPVDPPKKRVKTSDREVAGHLVSAWIEAHRLGQQRGDVLATHPLESVLKASGVEKVGETGSRVGFSGAHHESDRPVLTGDEVVVTRPGWLMREKDGGTYRLAAAKVSPVPRNSGLTENKAYDYATTQFDVTDPEVVALHKRVLDSIAPGDILKAENTPHITVRYGLHDEPSMPRRVELLAAASGPVIARFGDLTHFELPDKDVLKFDVESQQLENLNRSLGLLPNTQTHPDYHPHMTVAYLKPGTASKYVTRASGVSLKGHVLTFTELVYSSPDEQRSRIVVNCGGVGGKPGPCPTGSLGQTAGHSSLVSRMLTATKSLPRSLVSKVVTSVKAQYTKMEARYGPRYAKAIVGAAVLALPIPLPGSSLLAMAVVRGVAEMHRMVSGPHHHVRNINLVMSEQDIHHAALELIRTLHAEFAGHSDRPIENSFCPTGKGGGIDPSCRKSAADIHSELMGVMRLINVPSTRSATDTNSSLQERRKSLYAEWQGALAKEAKASKASHGDGSEVGAHELKIGQKVEDTGRTQKIKIPIDKITGWHSDTSKWDADSQKALAHYRQEYLKTGGESYTDSRTKKPVGPPEAVVQVSKGKVTSGLMLGDGSHRFAAAVQEGAKEVTVKVPIYKVLDKTTRNSLSSPEKVVAALGERFWRPFIEKAWETGAGRAYDRSAKPFTQSNEAVPFDARGQYTMLLKGQPQIREVVESRIREVVVRVQKLVTSTPDLTLLRTQVEAVGRLAIVVAARDGMNQL